MEKQLIISVSREYGSGGHEIAEKLAERFDLKFYDHNLLDEMFGAKQVEKERLFDYDEVPKFGLSRTVRGFSSSPEQNLSERQFEHIKELADQGKSFVICGRCADSVLKDYECMVPIFILGDFEVKLDRIMKKRNMDGAQAAAAILRHDKKRKAYHNHYCAGKWGDSRNYDICINSSRLGVDATVEYLEEYIRRFINK